MRVVRLVPTWVVLLVRTSSCLAVQFGALSLARCLATSLVWSNPRERTCLSIVGRGTMTAGVSCGGRNSCMSSARGRARARIDLYL